MKCISFSRNRIYSRSQREGDAYRGVRAVACAPLCVAPDRRKVKPNASNTRLLVSTLRLSRALMVESPSST